MNVNLRCSNAPFYTYLYTQINKQGEHVSRKKKYQANLMKLYRRTAPPPSTEHINKFGR